MPSLEIKPRRNGHTLKKKIRTLKKHYGSWDRAARRLGMRRATLRDIVKNDRTPTEENRKKIDRGWRRYDLEHLLALDSVGTGLQALTALQETDLSTRQQKIVERGIERLQEHMDLLSLGDIDRLRSEICDD